MAATARVGTRRPTGLDQALGTKWGLFRHYWVLAKLLITVVATVVLLLYLQTLGYFADRHRSRRSRTPISER